MAHMHYKGTGKVHSFRGQLADGGQDRIRIQGPVGAIAWRINKFEAMGITENETYEATIKIYRSEIATADIDSVVNFNDDELLAAILYGDTGSASIFASQTIIFDNTLFVRNIYVTYKSIASASAMNYYIELEEVKVGAAGMAQLAVAAARRSID